ncbi:MAG: phosphatase PAP2 family protein [Brevundimonas sp.]
MTPAPIPLTCPARTRTPTASSDASLAVLVFVALATSLFFHVFPGVDVSVSRWFHDAADGFVLAESPTLRALRSSSTWVMGGALLLTLFHLIGHALAGQIPGRAARRSLWLLSCLVVGPGLLVNGLLKEHWGRPRPNGTDIFGGEAPFQKVWVISEWCERNCSFVSGEASSAAWLVAAALIAPRRVRTAATALAAIYAFALSINRVAFGGHWLSDVLLAWLLSALVFTALARLILAPGEDRAWRPLALRSSEGLRP